MLDLATIPFVQAKWYRKTNGRVIDLIVLHDMEFPERHDSAEWCAGFFAVGNRVGSTHYCTDDDSIVQCVDLKDVCYGANGVNHNGIHIEQAGFAGQTEAEWTDDYSIRMIVKTSSLVAALCVKYDIPVRFVDAEGLKRGERGITTHREAERAFPHQGHTDPGPNYPIDRMIATVRSFMESQQQLAEWLALCLGDEGRAAQGPKGWIVEIHMRDRTKERELAAAGTPFEAQFVWLPWGAAIQFDHLEASMDT